MAAIWLCDINRLSLSFPHPMEALHTIWLQLAWRFLRKTRLKMLNLSDPGPRSEIILIFDIHIGSCTHLVNYICQFDVIDYNSFWKIDCATFSPYKSIRGQIWPCRKIGQGQPRFIIWPNLVVLEYTMLHTTFKIIGLLLPEKMFFFFVCFLRFLPYINMVAILVMQLTGPFEQTFISPSHGSST